MRRRGQEDIASKDVYLNGFALVAVVAYLLLMLINPPSQKSDQPPPGNLIVTIVWPEGGEQDVDLWVTSDGEERPIGFSNRSGKFWSLLRDDLGKRNDTLNINAENAYSRDIPQGRTTLNLFCYTCKAVPVPVGVEIVVVINGTSRTLLETKVTLYRHGQEITVVSFELTSEGTIVPGSTDNAFRSLYARAGQ